MPPKNILLQNIDFNEFVEKNVLILRGFTLQIGTDYLKYMFGTSNWGSSDWIMKQENRTSNELWSKASDYQNLFYCIYVTVFHLCRFCVMCC